MTKGHSTSIVGDRKLPASSDPGADAARVDQSRWRALVDCGPSFVYVVDKDDRFVFLNRTIASMPMESVLGRNLFDLLQPRDTAERRAIHAQVRATGGAVRFQTEFRPPVGDAISLEAFCVPVMRNGEVEEILYVANDVTARVRAERSLEHSERRFRAVAEKSEDAISLVSRDGTLLYASPAFTRILGFGPDELKAAGDLSNLHPDDLPAVRSVMGRIRQAPGASASVEYRARHRDGSWRWMVATGTNHLDDPAIAAVVGNVRDITERRGLQEQLAQSQKLEALGRLAGGVAHDFNNLLCLINMDTDWIRESLGPAHPLAGDVAQVQSAVRQAAALTRQLLAFSRKQVLELVSLSINDVVAEHEPMLARLLGEDVRLVVNLDPALGRVEADSGQMSQVLINLAVNARDAMPRGGRLLIETANVDLDEGKAARLGAAGSGRHVRLSVSDTGHGMDEATAARVFEPFFTTKGRDRGTGLGLATVFGIVKQTGGAIAVESQVGRGCRFDVFLPHRDGVPAVTATKPAARPAPRGQESILVVEDDERVRAAVVRQLRARSYQVTEADSGEAALRASRDRRFDLVVTDVVMTGQDGQMTAEGIRREHPDTRVLFVSGYTGHASVEASLREPGVFFLQKPFSAEELSAAVRQALEVTKDR